MFLICKNIITNYNKQNSIYKRCINVISNIIRTKINNIKIIDNKVYVNNILFNYFFDIIIDIYADIFQINNSIFYKTKTLYCYPNYLQDKSIDFSANNLIYYNKYNNKIIIEKNTKHIIVRNKPVYPILIIKYYIKNILKRKKYIFLIDYIYYEYKIYGKYRYRYIDTKKYKWLCLFKLKFNLIVLLI